MVLAGTLVLAKVKKACVFAAFLVLLQIVTIDNPFICKSATEISEAHQNMKKDFIAFFALLYIAASLPHLIHQK